MAPTLADAQIDTRKLENRTGGGDALNPVLARINYSFVAGRMIGEIEHGASRIFELVQAIKEYTYMDQAPEQEIDIHKGLESTLTILAYKLRKKSIQVEREFDRSIPKICAFGVELNQVWTNLIVKAIEAMQADLKLFAPSQDPMTWWWKFTIMVGHYARCAAENLRSVLYHQRRRRRNGARPGHGNACHQETSR